MARSDLGRSHLRACAGSSGNALPHPCPISGVRSGQPKSFERLFREAQFRRAHRQSCTRTTSLLAPAAPASRPDFSTISVLCRRWDLKTTREGSVGEFSQKRVGSPSSSEQVTAASNPVSEPAATTVDETANLDAALALALTEAAKAGRFDVVSQLAKELEARRLAGSNVVTLDAKKGGAK